MAAKYDDNNAAQMQELEDSASCSICLEIYKCPKLLPCGHTFCMNCIQETGLKTSKGPGDEMPCPICRRQFKIPSEGFNGLQNNYYVEGLIRVAQILDPSVASSIACDKCLEQKKTGKEAQRAYMYCSDCKQKLCDECCRHHRKLKMTKNHKLLSIYEKSPNDEDLIQSLAPSVCKLHRQKDLEIYCCLCKTCVCAICFTEQHEGHKVTDVTTAAVEFRKAIANNVETLKTCISQSEMKKSQITQSKRDVHETFGSLNSDIISRRDGLKQVADEQAKELIEELTLMKQSMMKEIHIKTENIDAQLARLVSYNSYCKKIINKGSACDICRSVGDLSARVNELQEENQSLTERQLKPLSLCFIETELEEEEERNMIGQLKELDHSKQETKTKQCQILDLKKENEALKAEIRANKTEIEVLKLANDKRKQDLDKEKQSNNACKLGQELEKEKLINKALQSQIENLTEQLKPEKMTTTPLQAGKDKMITEGKPSSLKTEVSRQRNLVGMNANYQEPTKSSGVQENQITYLERDRICALMTLPSVDIDEDIFYYLCRCRNQELSRISDKCNLFEPYKVQNRHKLAFEAKPQCHTDSVIAEFQELYGQTTISRVNIPEGIDPESLKSSVEAMAEFKDIELRFISQERVFKIVGTYREVTRAKEMLLEVIASNRPTSHELETTFNKKSRLSVQIPATPTYKEPSRSAQLYTAKAAIKTSKAGRSVYTVLNQDDDSVLLSVSKSLKIEVRHGDMTRMSNTDVVVSCINNQLDIDGPLAVQIMKAAGPKVRKELLSHKNRLSSLPTGCVIHTSAGVLRGAKAIIHVVRPQGSMDDLRNVFINCFSYTNDELRLKSICLPPIRFHVYDAQMIVDCFLDAVEMFVSTVVNGNPSAAAQHHPNPHHLNYIQLVTNDHHCIEQLLHRVRQT